MGRGLADKFDAVDSLRHPGIKPELLGSLRWLRASFFRFSCIHGRIGLATRRSYGSELGAQAWNRVGARHLLCRSNDRLFKICLYHPQRLLNLDFALFDCGGVASGEASPTLTVAWICAWPLSNLVGPVVWPRAV